ncbi:ATP-dependent RNA helicase Prp43 [Ophiocordyceps sinensis CO18]|uniref:ATP-dependent RNA helicase Prp43 n=1 Tax=Ophiocordyceps sinensis (strain Co18 / CGMCC 3.14243) TaxID=911162 RepID=T5AHP5_OPHSC|nr:ATP-dependent RNA helicase Prp43 [Ophiocordyceps sinensis CO18]
MAATPPQNKHTPRMLWAFKCDITKQGTPAASPREILQAVDLGLEDKIDPEYIALSREVPADQLGKPTVEYKMQGDSRQGVEMIIVPKAEKKVVHRRKDFKVVIMLATMDANKFQEYFDNCPLVHIAGRNFHVDNIYTAEAGPNFIVLAARVVIDIHENEKPGDILVFLPGEGEIERVCRLVRLATKNLDVFPLHSTLSASKQNLALKSSGPNRKCIVSTNVA